MTGAAERYLRVADGFTARVDATPPGSWGDPASCEGWTARDVVGHLTEWVPSFFFARWDVAGAAIPSAAVDPAAAWRALDAALRAGLADPEVASALADTPMGEQTRLLAFTGRRP